MRNGLLWGIGIVVLGVVAVYCFSKKENKNGDNKEKTKEDKLLDELVKSQSTVDHLTTKHLTDWFKSHQDKFPDTTKMIIAIPDEKTLKGLGYVLNCKIDEEKNILQFFYNDETTEILLIRLIKFESINSALQARLIEEDGMIVVTK